MIREGLGQAIIARVQSDTGTGGIWQTAGTYKLKSVGHIRGPRTTTALPLTTLCPYLVFTIETDVQLDGYAYDMFEANIDFHVWDVAESTVSAVRSLTIVERLFGDGIAQSTRIPSYGFHRHTLVLTTTGHASAPWVAGQMQRVGSAQAHEDDVYHWIETYRVNVSRVRT